MENIGYIHSYESFGAVDGPGVRFIVFMQGCPLRCLFCHNPDTWKMTDGKTISSKELFDKIISYKNFIKSGGVTFSGGEPLLQVGFLTDIITRCKEAGLHTAIDTSGAIPIDVSKPAIDVANMILLDIKDISKHDCITLTGQDNKNAMDTLNYCEYAEKDVWIRHVLLPEYTLNDEKLHRLAKVLKWYNCIKKIELIPFHKMGEYKWEYTDTTYKLSDIEPPTDLQINHVKEIFKSYDLPL